MARTGALARLKDKVVGSLRGTSASPPPRSGGVEVGYAPERDGDADPGEVVWTWVAYEDDPTQGKDRPVLVLGHDGPLLAAVPLSSKDHGSRDDAHEWVPVGTGGWDRSGRPSFADASRLLRVEPAAVRREGAALDLGRFDEVVARVRALHDWSG
jgi:hypothetical protein